MKHVSTAEAPATGWIYAPNGVPILRYEVEADGRALHVEWQSGPPLDDVKLGFIELARLLRENRCPVLLSDSNDSTGDWSELIPWVRYEFLPLALAGGLRYLIDVLPLDPASSFSVNSWRNQTRGLLHHEVFTSLSAAREGIRRMVPVEAGR